MSLPLALILASAITPVQAQAATPASPTPVEAASLADPLTVLLTHYAAPIDERAAQAPAPSTAPPGSGAKLAEAQADLSLIAEAFETFRDPAQTQRALASVPGGLDPDLRKFFKDRDTTLQAVDRTLAVFDFTWALRFPDPPCPARNLRAALIFSGDGLLEDLKADRPSPWLERLLGSQPAGRTAEQSLDLAAAVLPLTPLQYERERARARLLTEALNSERARGAARAKLYCERATAYARMALAHQPASAPVAAGRGTNGEAASASASVLLVAFKDGDRYRALGAGVLARSGGAAGFLTDASVVADPETHALRPGLAAFSRPADGSSKLEGPYALSVDTVPEFGAVLGRLDGARDLPALEVSDSTAAMSELLQALGHLNGFGAWTRTQGLVTRSEGDWFQSDAILDGEMAGGPLLDEQGRLVGLIARAPSGVAGVHAYRLRELLQGGTPSIIAPGKSLAGAPGTGSSAILSPAVAFPLQGFVAPGAGAIETGLPMNLGGVNWNAPELHVAGPHYYPHTTPSYSRPPSSSGSGESWGFGGGTYASPSFNGPMARDSVMGFLILSITEPTRKIFQGLGMLMFSPGTAFKNLQKNAKHHRAAPPAPTIVRVEPVKPPPPPPPPPKPKITGLVLTPDRDTALPGEIVTLTAALTFEGDYKQKAGNAVTFTAPADGRASFAGGKAETSGLTDGSGRARAALILRETPEDSAKTAFADLDAAARGHSGAHAARKNATATRKVKDAAESAGDDLDAEAAKVEPDEAGSEPGAAEAPAPEPPPQDAAPIKVKADSKGFTANAEIKRPVQPFYRLVVKAARSDGGMVTVTARIVTNDKSFDASKHAVNFAVTTPDGVKRSFTSVTDANGIAILDVHFPPGPAVASLPLDLTSAGLPIEAAKPAPEGSSHPVCEVAGGITAIAICAGAAVTAVAVPASGPFITLEAGVVITEASANGLFVTGTCVAMAKALDALAKPQPMAATTGDESKPPARKDDSHVGQPADPGQHPDFEKNTDEVRKRAKTDNKELSDKIKKDMAKRNWSQQELEEAIQKGKATETRNLNNGNPATAFEHPTTGKPVVVDNITGEVIQVGEKGFLFNKYKL